jgi:acyl-CoA thioester hydrolase
MSVMPRHRVKTPLRWSDTDAYGHINSVVILRLLEEARVQAWAGDLSVDPAGPPTALLVARAEIEYLEPLLHRVEPVSVDLWVTRIGGADFDMAYQVLDPPDGDRPGAVYAQAETLLVAYDQVTSRPRRISEQERKQLEGLLEEPVRWRRRRSARA